MRIVLGSSSKWRREIAQQALETSVELRVANIDEKAVVRGSQVSSFLDHPAVIARAKIQHLMKEEFQGPTLMLCFDTIVVFDSKVMEKPESESEMYEMVGKWLKAGNQVIVHTAVSVGLNSPSKILESVETASITITRDPTENELNEYLHKKDCIYSSGAVVVEYLIEMGLATIDGDISIIQGFPIEKVKQFIKELSI